MEKKPVQQELNSEGKYLNMLHVWEEIMISTSQRKNHIKAFKLGNEKYHQFLEKRYKSLYKLDNKQKQLISKQMASLIEVFPSGLIPAGTIIFELRTDEKSELYDKIVILFFNEENESIVLDNPYIAKFYSNRLFPDNSNSFITLQLSTSESNRKDNKLTLTIVKITPPFSYPDDFIELFKPPNESFEGLHDITVLLKDSTEKIFLFDLRKR